MHFFHSIWKNLHLTENFYTHMSVVSVTNMRYGLKVVFMNSYILRPKRPISSQVPQPTPTKCLKSGGEVNGLMASEFLIMPCQKNPWAAVSNEDYEEPRKISRCSALFCWGVNLGLPSPHTLVPRLTDCIDLARFFEGDCQCVTLYAVYLVFV